MEGPAAATCIATVNSVGNLGGLIGPFMIGEAQHCGACCDCRMHWCCFEFLLRQSSFTCMVFSGCFELLAGELSTGSNINQLIANSYMMQVCSSDQMMTISQGRLH